MSRTSVIPDFRLFKSVNYLGYLCKMKYLASLVPSTSPLETQPFFASRISLCPAPLPLPGIEKAERKEERSLLFLLGHKREASRAQNLRINSFFVHGPLIQSHHLQDEQYPTLWLVLWYDWCEIHATMR